MQDFMDLCLRRQSCRDFADKPVEHEKLVRCIEAARLAPSGCNSQPWGFVVAESAEKVKEVGEACHFMGSNEYMKGAKAFIAVLEEYAQLMPMMRSLVNSQYFAKHDLGAAAMTLCYAAEDQGLGSCVVGLFDRARVGKALDIPKDKQFACLIAIGYPANDKVRNKVRKPVEEIVRYM